ncbi:MAG TPA: glycosyltransferase [Candidatus Binataceae bacterium]|nr:glycosyltransferase [Candidatus Binataceae bacterium]
MAPQNAARRVLQLGKYFAPHRGGIETHLELLSFGLARSCEVRVMVAGGGRLSMQTDFFGGLQVDRLATPLTLAATPVCPGMARAIRAARPDLVHLHFPNPMAAWGYLAARISTPLIVTWHSDVVRQRLLDTMMRPLINTVLARASAIIATSPDYLESSPVLSSRRSRVRVIPYGIALEELAPPPAAAVAEIRQRYRLPLVLGVGRLVYYKGWEYLIAAMRQVNATLLIVGDGPLRPALQRQVVEAGLSRRVFFIGELDRRQITPYYHACEVFALASVARSEAFAIVQLEAMAAERPVVNTALATGVPFVSPHGVSGLTVAPRDAGALAGAINRLLADPAARARCGRAGAQRVAQLFSRERMVAQTLSLYDELLGESRRTSAA